MSIAVEISWSDRRTAASRATRATRASRRRAALAFLIGPVVAGCGASGNALASGVQADSVQVVPLQNAFRLDEASAAARSARLPGVVFTINDSGNEEVLYAFDTTGNAMGRWVMRKTRNRDWEALATGPCPAQPQVPCVYVGDVGDNSLARPSVLILHVPEPDSLAMRGVGELFPDSIFVRFADGPHNIEAIVRAPDGAILLFTKEVLRRPDGQRRPTLVYRVPPEGWSSGAQLVAALVDSIPIVPGAATRQQVTDASLSQDGHLLAVRTYSDVWLFASDSLTGRPLPGVAPVVCNIAGLREPQGEGVGILQVHQGRVRLVLSTEGNGEPFRLVNCPLPVAGAPAGRDATVPGSPGADARPESARAPVRP